MEGGELWLATSSDRRVSVWASDWLKDKCELLDWLSFPAPAGPEVSVAPASPCPLVAWVSAPAELEEGCFKALSGMGPKRVCA